MADESVKKKKGSTPTSSGIPKSKIVKFTPYIDVIMLREAIVDNKSPWKITGSFTNISKCVNVVLTERAQGAECLLTTARTIRERLLLLLQKFANSQLDSLKA